MKKSRLLLKNGMLFEGYSFGAEGTAIGEVVFNTAMSGYQEVITDPSYRGQMVTFTYPHIGNYGINSEDGESVAPAAAGVIVRDLCRRPSNYRSTLTLDAFLREHGVCGIYGLDTRMLTRCLREEGAMSGIISTGEESREALMNLLLASPEIGERDLVSEVTAGETGEWKRPLDRGWYFAGPPDPAREKYTIAAMDFGVKQNILRILASLGYGVTVVPAGTSANAIRKLDPDGIFLSNGPGDPQSVDYAVTTLRNLINDFPIFGICLGHQILALAAGAQTFKLRFGHHGSNHPVKECETGVIAITAQNHNYAVDERSLVESGFRVTHRNLNDGTVEGMRHRTLPICSLQFHPEAAPGPHDALGLFARFQELIDESGK
ncbi:glutamine-hydrolyzing carbamoyl-phosphate synthase small subunit [bacterium]|nr:glutamine-hydrolyzing carbamoyl-phosphate synthase small subunit [bacterium]